MRVALTVTFFLIGLTGCGRKEGNETPSQGAPTQGASPQGASFQQLRAGFQTRLTKTSPAPQRWDDEDSPPGVKKVRYPSAGRELLAWVSALPADGSKRAAVVYLHGGFAFGADDYADCKPLLDAGFIVMCPTYRGENGNPGNYELFLGEVDDAVAAARWLATQPGVDAERMYAFGHSVGGGVASLLSLIDDVPVRLTGGAGGLYPNEVFAEWAEMGMVRFNPTDATECRVRRLLGNVADMRRPHFAYIGQQDSLRLFLSTMQKEAGLSNGKLTVATVPGDHGGSLRPAMKEFLREIEKSK